jgi:MYXO-CTERM domain-containing protein
MDSGVGEALRVVSVARDGVRASGRPVWALIVAFCVMLGAQLVASEARAQACPSDSFCYYVPAALPTPPNYSVGWDLNLSSSNGTVTGTYTIGSGTPVPYSVTPSTPLNVTLSTTEGVASTYRTAEQRGIYIEASSDALNVTRRLIVGPWQSSASIKDNTRSLGRRFRLAGYSLNGPNTPDTGFDHVSIYAPTGGTVSIQAPPGAALPFWEGESTDTVTVSLSAGQTYIQRVRLAASNTCDNDITGALLTSSAPVSVTTGGRGWAGAAGAPGLCVNAGGCGDEGADHIFPTTNIGTEYVVSRYNTNNARVTAVVADSDATSVSIDGAVVATLDAGEVHYFRPGGVTLIETSAPAYVYQNAGLSGCEMGLAFVPPASFGQTAVNTAAFNVTGSGVARVLIETTQVSTLTYDGAALPGSATTTAVPGRPEWSVVSFSTAAGDHLLEAGGDFQLGLATGGSGTGLFAYYNIFNLATCGDGNIDQNEGCDDGGTTPGDGCSSLCKIELLEPGCTSDDDCASGLLCSPTNTCVECLGDANCNDGNACTANTCNAGVCDDTSIAQGTACAGGVCNGDAAAPACVACIDDAPLLAQDTGCPASAPACVPDGAGGLTCGGCVFDTDCDDSNSCTDDVCNVGTCENTTLAQGTACDAGAGVCNGDANAPSCDVCVPNSGSSPDTGCTPAASFCDASGGAPACVECLLTAQCGAGQACIDDACEAASVDILTPADGAAVTGAATITGAATDGARVRVQVFDPLGASVEDATITAFAGAWSLTTGALAVGDGYTVAATVETSDGAASDTSSFDVKLANGEPCSDDAECGSNSCQANVCACDDGLDCAAGEVCDLSGTPNTCEPQDTCGNGVIEGAEECDDGAAADGDGCSAQCVVEDRFTCVGQPSACADVTDPVVTIDSPGADPIATADPVIEGTSEPDSEVTVTFVDAAGATRMVMATADASGDWSIDLSGLGITLAEGVTTLSASAIDAAGNTSAVVTSDVDVDTTAPTLTVATPADGATVNQAQPAITGTTEPGAVVTVVVDAGAATEQTLTATADAAGAWSVTPSALADGAHTVQADALDEAGNAAPQATSGFTVDTTAPAVAIGAPADGSISSEDDPTLSGTAEPGATVAVSVDGNLVDTVTADANGAWSTDAGGPFADGAHTIEVVATDAAGNTASDTSTFTVDATAPTLTIDSPADGASVDTATPTVSGTSDPGATVEVFVDGAKVGEAVAGGDGSWSFTLPDPLPNGPATLGVRTTDAVGNVAEDSVDVTIALFDMILTIDAPTPGQVTTDTTPTVSGTANPGETVEVFVDGAKVGDAVADANGDWSLELTDALGEGEHTIEVTGQSGATVDPVTFTVDTSAPEVAITAPAPGAQTDDTTPTITGTGEPGATVTVVIDGSTAGTATVGNDGTWTFTPEEPLGEGDHTIEATIEDDAGNAGSSGEVTVTVDTTPPDLEVTSPRGGDEVDEGDTVTGTSEPGTTVVVTVDGVVVGEATADENGDWSVTLPEGSLPEGDATVEVEARDPAGNTSSETIEVTTPGGVDPDTDASTLAGGCGGCASAPTAPTDASLLLLGLGLFAWRRRRRA